MTPERASRFQAYLVSSTYDSERTQLEQNLSDGTITKEQFEVLLSKLELDQVASRNSE